MRILVVAPEFPAINQPWIDTYLEQLILRGFDPVIFTQNARSTSYQPKVDALKLRERMVEIDLSKRSLLGALIKSLACPRLWSFACSRAKANPGDRLGSFLRALHCSTIMSNVGPVDLVHSHAETISYQLLPLVELQGTPLIITFHGLTPAGVHQLSAQKRSVLYKAAKRVLVNTEFAKDQVVSIGCPQEKVAILPQGIPLAEFSMAPRTKRKQNTSISLLTVGRCDRHKGYRYALLTLRRLLNEGIPARWYFVGEGPDAPSIRRLAERLHLGPALHWVSRLTSKELKELYQRCDLFVLPSIPTRGWQETQGVVLQEAQACGCIPLAARSGGIPECITDGVDGFLVKPKSSRAMADVIRRVWQGDVNEDELRRAGREKVMRRYSADEIGAQMASFLQAERNLHDPMSTA